MDQPEDHPQELGGVGVVAVVAGDVGHEHARAVGGEQPGDGRGALEEAQDRALVREERRDALEPRGAGRVAGQRQLPDARQVPGPDLPRCATELEAVATEGVDRPGKVRVRATRLGVREPERLLVELHVGRLRDHTHVIGQRRVDLGEVGHPAAVRGRPLGVEQAEDRDLDPVGRPGRLDHRVGVLPPRRRALELGQAPEQRPIARAQHDGRATGRELGHRPDGTRRGAPFASRGRPAAAAGLICLSWPGSGPSG